jgi:threonine dehydrogenase-like Zn-dependent dehydrogenase
MKAVQFNFSYARYGLGLALGRFFPSLLWNGLATTGIHEVEPPQLPGPDWVMLDTKLGGICGTDLGTIYLHTSPYYTTVTSFPYTFGHENVARISERGEEVDDWKVGERVVVEPTLWCAPRGFNEKDWCVHCARGEINLCQRYAEGNLAPGIMIGTASQTGGSWSRNFVAHQSQLYRLPESISDENALMLEPFACGLHAALHDFPSDDETILIIGAGTIALATLAALRALGSKARILVSARYDFQAAAAQRLGADRVLMGADLYEQIADETNAKMLKPIIGKRVVVGGLDRVYECVGSDSSLDDALRLTRGGGTVIIVGVPAMAKGVDWTAIYSQELRVLAADRYSHNETYKGKTKTTFEIAIDLIASGKADLAWMVSRRYPLEDYSKALNELRQKTAHPIIKAVFDFSEN